MHNFRSHPDGGVRRAAAAAALLLAPAWLALAAAATDVPLANPAPAPAVQVPAVEVTAPKGAAAHRVFDSFHEGAFARLRSGPMIEAILWRHHYLAGQPKEEAIILTTHEGNRITSATTVYTRQGKVYASSDVLGEALPIKGLAAADLHGPNGPARALQFIVSARNALLDAAEPLSSGEPSPPFGSLLAVAEETGDYWILGRAAGPPAPVDPHTPAAVRALVRQAHRDANRAVREELTQAFVVETATEVLGWTYQALHDPARAGIVPVALGPLKGRFLIAGTQPERFVTDPQVLVFDWEGAQYCYEPDVGTWVQKLPIDVTTGLPYLCIRNGALLECVYFGASYSRQHPGEKAVVLADDPPLAAYAADHKLNLFLPDYGRFGLPPDYLDALGSPAYLAQVRDRLLAIEQQRGAPASAIPQSMEGDDGDMQIRRAYVAFQAAGIACQLEEEGLPSLRFTWDRVSYVYGPDQRVRRAAGPPPG